MLKQIKVKAKLSHISKSRMRHRAPIESIKINPFKQDTIRDIIEINKGVVSLNKDYIQYMKETIFSFGLPVSIFEGYNKVFEGRENISIEDLTHSLSNATKGVT